MILIINNLKQAMERYYSLLLKIDDASFSLKPTPDKWSKKEELGHLIDSHQNSSVFPIFPAASFQEWQ